MAKMTTIASQQKSVSAILTQSVAVLTDPTGAQMEAPEQRGSLLQASLYVGAVAVLAGLLSFPLGLSGVLRVFLSVLVGFFVFTGLVYATGQTHKGSFSFNDLAYTFSLFIAPLSLVVPMALLIMIHPATGLGIQVFPILSVGTALVLLLQAYLGWLVLQRPGLKMIDTQSLPAALFVAVIGTWVAQMLVILIKAPWMV